MKKLSVFLFVFLLAQNYLSAQSFLKDKSEMKPFATSVMQSFSKNDISGAFVLLKKYWPLPESEISQLELGTLQQFGLVASRFGEVIGHEFVKEFTVGDFAVKQTYVLRFQKHLLRMTFTFYRNEQGWVLNGFKWDDKLDELFHQ